jgi:hypothetical protein
MRCDNCNWFKPQKNLNKIFFKAWCIKYGRRCRAKSKDANTCINFVPVRNTKQKPKGENDERTG